MPLDISDEELMGDEATLNSAIQKLDENGWNTQRRYLRASWIVSASCVAGTYAYPFEALAVHFCNVSRRNT